jgi:hypothetical protein
MRMMMHVSFPVDVFNAAVRDGSAGAKIRKILDQLKPEAVYFTDHFGKRSAFVVVHMTENSEIPKFAEPWFLLFNASIEIHAAMTPADLGAAGLDDLGKMWG